MINFPWKYANFSHGPASLGARSVAATQSRTSAGNNRDGDAIGAALLWPGRLGSDHFGGHSEPVDSPAGAGATAHRLRAHSVRADGRARAGLLIRRGRRRHRVAIGPYGAESASIPADHRAQAEEAE